LATLINEQEDLFADRSRFSMDWFYPVLGGAVRGEAARARLEKQWETFVVPDLGVLCVSDQPWVTAAESAELVLALATLGDTEVGTRVLRNIQHLRDPDDGRSEERRVGKDGGHGRAAYQSNTEGIGHGVE